MFPKDPKLFKVAPYKVHLVGSNKKADLIGVPVRLFVSDKTFQQSSGQAGDKIEFKERTSDKVELLIQEELLNKLWI